MSGPDVTPLVTVDTNAPFTWPSVLPRAGEAAGILDVTAVLGAAGGEIAYRLGPILNGSDAVLRQGDAVIGGIVLGLFAGTLLVGSVVLDNMDRQVQGLPT